ncbi:MAG: DUF305 domain-containing protein, partial [Pseudomonadota bacterium]
LLIGISEDPRAGLAAGFRDAGEAIMGLELIAALPKPAGFFDPDNPTGRAPAVPVDETEEGEDAGESEADAEADTDDASDEADTDAAERDEDEQSLENTQWGERYPFLSFSNTDMAFFGDTLIAGNYHGFNIYKLDEVGLPNLVSSVVCPGGQGDVSVVGDLLIMSVEQTRGRVDCGLQGIDEDVSADRFRGVRIFDISNLRRPIQVGQVQTCRGSHTHSVVAERDGKIIVYNSGTSSVRPEEELAGCAGPVSGDDTALFSIDVIEIPVNNPAAARIVDSPRVFADLESGDIAGLWRGGESDDDAQYTSRTDQCHDITIFPSANIAAGACSGNGIILDISDPMAPKRIDDVFDDGFAYWHSATFNNDGTKVLFTDEWGGGARPRCRTYDPMDWGADAIYDIVDGKLDFKGYFKIPAPQTDNENCVAHNGSVVPVPGRDVFVQAWYQGGMSVIDFTDSANAFEIGYFDRGPIDDEQEVLGGYWSTYWYDGKIYGTAIVRGLDVFALSPSDMLSENEIAAAELATQGEVFNPQQQLQFTWPDVPVVARAYMDQLARTDTLSAELTTELDGALGEADTVLANGGSNERLAGRLRSMAVKARGADASDDMSAKRLNALAATLMGVAEAVN